MINKTIFYKLRTTLKKISDFLDSGTIQHNADILEYQTRIAELKEFNELHKKQP